MGKTVRVSKGFLVAGFSLIQGGAMFGDFAKCAGSALAIFRLTFRGLSAEKVRSLPLLRVRFGARKVVLEMRAHTAKRCTKGSWQRVTDFPTPSDARACTRLGRAIHASVLEGLPTAGRSSWEWRGTGNRNETRTDVTQNVKHPRLGGGKVTRGARALPNQTLVWGWAPARGNQAATHEIK